MTTIKAPIAPRFLRPGETHALPLSVAFPSRLLGVEDVPDEAEITSIAVDGETFEGASLAAAAQRTALPGRQGLVIAFTNTSQAIVEVRGQLILEQEGTPAPATDAERAHLKKLSDEALGVLDPQGLDAGPVVGARKVEPAPAPPNVTAEHELTAAMAMTAERDQGHTRSNAYVCRLTPGQMKVIRSLLRGKAVHPAERESVRVAFERSIPA